MKRLVDKEQYYTPKELSSKCIAFVNSFFPLEEFDFIVEPSAGDGSFLQELPGHKTIAIDIDPKSSEIIKADFLAWAPTPKYAGAKVLTIGNPPFGARASVALKFIAHAAEFSDVIAFVLPMSFNKYTFQNMVPSMFHLKASFDCTDIFLTGENTRQVKTVFQIWVKSEAPRTRVTRKMTHTHFKMRHAHLSRTTAEELEVLRNKYAFAIAQVGSNFAPRDPRAITQGSYWFIEPLEPDVRERFSRMSFSHLDGMNVAHKSLSKSDIIEAYDVVLAADGFVVDGGVFEESNVLF
jgi:hypothetical protein